MYIVIISLLIALSSISEFVYGTTPNNLFLTIKDKEICLSQSENTSATGKRNPRKRMRRAKQSMARAPMVEEKIVVAPTPIVQPASPAVLPQKNPVIIVETSNPLDTKKEVSTAPINQKKVETVAQAMQPSVPLQSLPSAPSVPPVVDQKKRTIKVSNNITKKMTTYRHWGSHTPILTLKANGIVIPYDEPTAIEITNNILDMDYHADFYSGMRTSQDSASFIVDKDANTVNVTFSWDAKPRIIVDKATAQ